MINIQHNRPIEILLVEDSDADAYLTQHTLKRAKIENNIHRARDGEEALVMLKKEIPYDNVVTPDLILLDINLPKISGKEVLEDIKNNDFLKSIPVIALSGSSSENDIREMYELQAISYMTKPIDITQFKEVVNRNEIF